MTALWKNITDGSGAHYSVLGLKGDGMTALRLLFPEGEADYMNVVFFSTSGVHGHYGTIEDVEKSLAGDVEKPNDVTFVVVHPRMVTIRYGNSEPQDAADIAFLKKLRASSHAAMAEIGAAPPSPGT